MRLLFSSLTATLLAGAAAFTSTAATAGATTITLTTSGGTCTFNATSVTTSPTISASGAWGPGCPGYVAPPTTTPVLARTCRRGPAEAACSVPARRQTDRACQNRQAIGRSRVLHTDRTVLSQGCLVRPRLRRARWPGAGGLDVSRDGVGGMTVSSFASSLETQHR